MYAPLEVSVGCGNVFVGTTLTSRAFHLRPPYKGANSNNKFRTCSCCIHKQNSENCLSASADLRFGVAYRSVTVYEHYVKFVLLFKFSNY